MSEAVDSDIDCDDIEWLHDFYPRKPRKFRWRYITQEKADQILAKADPVDQKNKSYCQAFLAAGGYRVKSRRTNP